MGISLGFIGKKINDIVGGAENAVGAGANYVNQNVVQPVEGAVSHFAQAPVQNIEQAPAFAWNNFVQPSVNTIGGALNPVPVLQQDIGAITGNQDLVNKGALAQQQNSFISRAGVHYANAAHGKNVASNLLAGTGEAVGGISSALPLVGFGGRQAGEDAARAIIRSAAQNAAYGGVVGGAQGAMTGNPTVALKSAATGAAAGAALGGAAEGAGQVIGKVAASPLVNNEVGAVGKNVGGAPKLTDTPLYHGSPNAFSEANIPEGRGLSLTTSKDFAQNLNMLPGKGTNITEYRLSPTAKILDANTVADKFPPTSPTSESSIVAYAKKNGYNAIDMRNWGADLKHEAEIRILSKDAVRPVKPTVALKSATKESGISFKPSDLTPEEVNAGKAVGMNPTETAAAGARVAFKGAQAIDKTAGKPLVSQVGAVGRNVGYTGASEKEVSDFAKSFNISKKEAKVSLASQDTAPQTPQSTVDVATGKTLPAKLPVDDRWKIIQQENQQTNSNININPAEGNTRGAIAQATGEIQDLDRKGQYADHLASKLSANDHLLLSERADPNVEIKPDNPAAFQKAAAASDDYYDTALDIKRQGGNPALRYGNGRYTPLNLKITAKEAADKGIPEDQLIHSTSGNVIGYRDETRQYRSYTDAKAKAGLDRLNETPTLDRQSYHNNGRSTLQGNLIKESLKKTNPNEIINETDAGGAVLNGKYEKFQQAPGGLPFKASKNVRGQLKNLGEAWEPSSKAGKVAAGAVEKVGGAGKKLLFAPITTFHQAHVAGDVSFANTLGGHPGVALDAAAKEIKTKGGLSKGGWFNMIDEARKDAPKDGISTIDQAKKMGIEISDGTSHLQRNLDAHALAMAKMARDMGIDPTSADAIAVGRQYNHIIGRENAAVEGLNPTIQKITRWYALAPNYLRTRLKLVFDAFVPKFLGGAGYDKALGMSRPGAAARSAVVGSRLGEGMVATLATIALMQKFPTPQQLVQNFGLSPSNPVPSIILPNKNSKGEHQIMSLATDPLGLAAGMALTPATDPNDPFHFIQSRQSPYISFATSVATNKDWSGQPLVDPNQPNAWPLRVGKAAAGSFIPIGIQNLEAATPYGLNQNQSGQISIGSKTARLTPAEAVAQNFLATRVRTDPNDPQVQANQKFANTVNSNTNILKSGKFSQLDPSLKDDPKYGQYWADQYAKLHPTNTTGPGGFKYAEPYNPNSSLLKYQAYAAVDASGKPVLSPVFYADKKQESATPGYPSSPLYKLDGNGTGANGDQSPKALVALQYQFNQDPAAKQDLMNANGGQNGWLSQYETKLGDYSQNYQQNLTNYFQGLGYSSQAINDYWTKHPSSPDPISQPSFPQATTDLMNQYYNLSASDPTAAAKFFSTNASVLGDAFDQLAQHSNAIRQATGQLQLQGYPTESQHVKDLLSSMPQGADAASKKARALVISGNPDVNQYLASVALYESLDKGAQFRYKNPANMNATEGENINAGGTAGQTFLKDTTSLGQYDIGKNAAGQYSFMQGGGFPTGSVSSSQTAYNKSKSSSGSNRAKYAIARATRKSNTVKMPYAKKSHIYAKRVKYVQGLTPKSPKPISLATKIPRGFAKPKVSLKA